MLEAVQLACLKGDRLLFRDLDFSVAEGDLLRVAGPNGFGKTSLLRILCGLAMPEYGEVHWLGGDVRRDRESFHRTLLYIGHSPALNDMLTPIESLQFACASSGSPISRAAGIAALERVGLTEQVDLTARVLSQGQRRRVGLARLFAGETKRLWILDEPFTALDVTAVADLATTISKHCDEGGCVVMTTHQDAPFTLAPRVLDLVGAAC